VSGADLAAAGGHSAATLYEASGLPIACDPGLRPAWPGAGLAGPAYTVRGVGGDNMALHNAVVTAPAGHVLVVDVQGAAHGHWGEVLAVAAQVRGLVGLVIDGGVRDVDELARLEFPVFARTVTVLGTAKHHPGELGVPVTVGGVTVRTGDLVVGDSDGVVALPHEHIESIVARADARVAKERRILDQLRAGRTTLELYDLDPGGSAGSPQGRGGRL
jgi:4-hydroxy-4-methyl-2-oxoglutarate aldolase